MHGSRAHQTRRVLRPALPLHDAASPARSWWVSAAVPEGCRRDPAQGPAVNQLCIEKGYKLLTTRLRLQSDRDYSRRATRRR